MNQTPNEFRVLVIDDNHDVIKRLDQLSPKHRGGGVLWDVMVVAVHIELIVEQDGTTRICGEAIRKILTACERPFDLILADYGFASSAQWAEVESGKISPDDFLKKTRTAAHLLTEIESHLATNPPNDSTLKDRFQKHLKNYAGKLYLYTFTSAGTKHTFPNVDSRAKQTQAAFRKAQVIGVDTRTKFFDGDRFDQQATEPFYAYLVTGLLDEIINRELLEHIIVAERERLEFVRHKRSVVAVFVVAALAGGICGASSWIVEVVIGLFKADKIPEAWTLVGLAFTVLFALGMFLPFLFERVLTNILAKLSSQKSE